MASTIADDPPVQAGLSHTGEHMEYMTSFVGRYPFDVYGILAADELFFYALETQTLSLHPGFVVDETQFPPEFAQPVLVHELAHQWFGDDLALAEWSDLWLSEGHATWYEGHYADEVFGIGWVDRMQAAYEEANQLRADFGPVARPSGNDFLTLFSNNVYDGGGLVLYALHNRVGERRFYEIERTWAQRFSGESPSTWDFILHAAKVSHDPGVIPFLARWVFGDTVPPMPGHPDWVSPPASAGAVATAAAQQRPAARGGKAPEALIHPPCERAASSLRTSRSGVGLVRWLVGDRPRSSSTPCSRSRSRWCRSPASRPASRCRNRPRRWSTGRSTRRPPTARPATSGMRGSSCSATASPAGRRGSCPRPWSCGAAARGRRRRPPPTAQTGSTERASCCTAIPPYAYAVLIDDVGTPPEEPPISFWLVLLILLATLPVALRRRWPLAVLAVTLAAALAATYVDDAFVFPGPLVALYSVAAYVGRPRSLYAAAGTAAVLVPLVLAIDSLGFWELLGIYALFGAAWLLGDNVRTRRERARRLEAEHEANVRRAAAEEQARIARELHDVIGHSVSVMTIQAAAAGDAFDSRPAQVREALRAIESTGREAWPSCAACWPACGRTRTAPSRPPPASRTSTRWPSACGRRAWRSSCPSTGPGAAAAERRPVGVPDRAGGAHQHAQARARDHRARRRAPAQRRAGDRGRRRRSGRGDRHARPGHHRHAGARRPLRRRR